MCSIFFILSAQCYFCLIKYTRNQFNTKVYPTGKTTLPRRTISRVMDNITILCERVVAALKYKTIYKSTSEPSVWINGAGHKLV